MPPKKVPRGTPSTLSAPSFEEDKAEETDESGGQVHPPNVGQGKQNLVCITEAVRLKNDLIMLKIKIGESQQKELSNDIRISCF